MSSLSCVAVLSMVLVLATEGAGELGAMTARS
jgi:hypothetical protein